MTFNNVGWLDRLVRLLLGAVLVALAATGTIGWWGYLGVVFLATALLSWCPIYSALGIRTFMKVKDGPMHSSHESV